MKCNHCVNKNTEYCETCIDHPKWANRPKHSNFQLYKPTCPFGYKDCICDPAYILWSNPKWYKELYNTLSPEEAAKEEDGSCGLCDMGSNYDNEDK